MIGWSLFGLANARAWFVMCVEVVRASHVNTVGETQVLIESSVSILERKQISGICNENLVSLVLLVTDP